MNAGAGTTTVSESVQATGLTPSTEYGVCLVTSNEFGTEVGPVVTFTTPAVGPPAAIAGSDNATKVTGSTAQLNAEIVPNGAETSYEFQYGTSSVSGHSTPPAALGASDEDAHPASAVIQGLTAGTKYEYRVVASNEAVAGHREEIRGPESSFTTEAAGSNFALPDGREWEMVSPASKEGAYVSWINEFNGVIEAAADGDAMTWETDSPTEAEPRGSTFRVSQILSTRVTGGWSSQDIETPHNYESGVKLDIGYEYRFFSSDLSLALLEPEGQFTPLSGEEASPVAKERTPYVRNDATCEATPATCYMALVTEANTPPGTKIGGNEKDIFGGGVSPVGATPDLSHVVLQTNKTGNQTFGVQEAPSLTKTAVPYGGLYEWSSGQFQLVSVLPDGTVAESYELLGAKGDDELEARNAISSDGSRIVWSTGGEDANTLYMRDTVRGETVQIGGTNEAVFTDASSDDSKVFFKQGVERADGDNGGDLYVFEETESSRDGGPLAGKVTRLTEGAEMQGTVLGVSEDGSYVYFVANGVLGDGAAHGATPCSNRGRYAAHSAQTCSLYVEHYNGSVWEAPAFIATLSGVDSPDWQAEALERHTSRVSPDGRYLAFMSQRSLTGYDNTDVNEHPSEEEESEGVSAQTKVEHQDEEVYEYHASENPGTEPGTLICASCNPTGARPAGRPVDEGAEAAAPLIDDGFWGAESWVAANVPGFTPYATFKAIYQSRYLFNSGRLFFNSHDPLTPQAVNGTWNVYEYEPPGIGSCTEETGTYSPRSGGCVGLISAGTSPEESAFLDASENGDDVFFLTLQENNVEDAHVCGAEGVACTAAVAPPPPCSTEASCRPAPNPQPSLYGAPPSATFNGAGNLAPPPPPAVVKPKAKVVKCKKGEIKTKKDRCVKKPKKKHTKSKKASHGKGRA